MIGEDLKSESQDILLHTILEELGVAYVRAGNIEKGYARKIGTHHLEDLESIDLFGDQIMSFDIDGVQYREREKEQLKRYSKFQCEIAAIASAYSMFDPLYKYPRSNTVEMPAVDLVAEFKLIQHKQSNLTRRQREWIIWKFNKKFEQVIK